MWTAWAFFSPGYVFCNCLRCHWTSNIFDWELFTYGLSEIASWPFCDAFCQAVFTCTCQDSGIRIHFAQILLRISLGCLTVLKQNVMKVDNDQGSAVSHHWQGTVKYRWKSMKGSSIDDQPCRIFVLFTCLARFEPRPPQFATKGTRARCRSWHNIHTQKSLH